LIFLSQVKTVDEYDPVRDVWISAPNMEARRSTLGVAMLNDHIYAVVSVTFSSLLGPVHNTLKLQ
jgi:hypothetical protein